MTPASGEMWARMDLVGVEVLCVSEVDRWHVHGRLLHTGAAVVYSRQFFRRHFVNVTRANEIIGAARVLREPSQSALL